MRWQIVNNGKIRWDVAADSCLPHEDHIEMSGQKCSLWVQYGVDENSCLTLKQTVVYPGLRTIPNNTHASLMWECDNDMMGKISVKGLAESDMVESKELVDEILFDGILTIKSHIGAVVVIRRLLPSGKSPYAIQEITLTNQGDKACLVTTDLGPRREYRRGCHGVYYLERMVTDEAGRHLEPGEVSIIRSYFVGRNIKEEVTLVSTKEEIGYREAFVQKIRDNLVLETAEPIVDNAFCLAKLRAAESVFQTKGGLMHGPGGLSYYAAVWTNDQVEYAGPFFPYLGEENAIEASRNAYDLYLPFMGENYYRIPASIIAEGVDIWEGAGDRGDAAMYAYGASRFALEMGDMAYAQYIYPAIEWCLEYCRRQKTIDGVIASDSDELEGRFPTGKANLSTSSLTYAAYENAAYLAKVLGKTEDAANYERAAEELKEAIESYFGANVEGYDTYRYYDGNDRLRAWICLPLVFGIEDRKEATVSALFSENLWMPDGLATESGDTVFWDRSTLYALRGVFHAGEKEKAYEYLLKYSTRRTLGEHVPYPVEAWPEGNQRHLSAESALYCRIITEGILGLEAVGLDQIRIQPQIPAAWKKICMKQVHLCGQVFDLQAEAVDEGYLVKVICGEDIIERFVPEGKSTIIEFNIIK